MAELDVITAILVFFTYVIIDVLYACYVLCVSARRAWSAAFFGAALYSLAAFGVMTYSKNSLYILPLAFGSFIGTFTTIKFHDRFVSKK